MKVIRHDDESVDINIWKVVWNVDPSRSDGKAGLT